MPPFLNWTLHLAAPIAVAWFFFRSQWKRAALIMVAANLVALDRVFFAAAETPTNCAINAYPLHTMLPISLYGAMMFLPWLPVRLLGIGLVLHMLVDALGCGL
ncbi:hypothetical protein AUP74_03019 [Microbulbifer aggregans]|uniref:Uncharacterized protein n=1 Tax=Microbulbifer aggregans TaxID=1769779 RepID=A0A1C9WB66_9GAMM|nr:DUF6122 family protein [Microbulbifer aggregans]AOS98386.1 hypothetical protein AUP74_03019 [Microbulbifer aggregans]